MKTAEEFVTFGQGNIEAFVKSGQVVASGLQDISKLMAANAQAAMEETMSTFRALATARSVKEAFELQTTLARSAIEKAMAQGGQVAETSFKVAEQAIAPIASRVQIAVDSFSKAA